MADDLELDLPLTGAQASAGHEVTLKIARRALSGTGWSLANEELRVRAPAGVAPRTVLRLPGMGHARADGSSGDVLVRVLIDETEHSQELRLSPGDATRGISRAVETVKGPVVVEIPAGVMDGWAIKRGSLFLRIRVDPLLPDSLLASALPGRRKAVALLVAAAVLVGLCASAWGLIVLLQLFGYSRRF